MQSITKLKFVSLVALLGHVQVLIIGGGDGGVAREVAKHEGVKRIVQCEIDQVNLSIGLGLLRIYAHLQPWYI